MIPLYILFTCVITKRHSRYCSYPTMYSLAHPLSLVWSVQEGLGRVWGQYHRQRNMDLWSPLWERWSQSEPQNQLEHFSQYGLGVQYDLSDKSYLSIGYSGASEKLGGKTTSTNTIIDDSGAIFYKSIINKDEKEVNNSISLNYQQALLILY